MPADAFDVVVVGAGPAGTSAATAAVSTGASVLLVEKQPLPRYKMCGGGLIGPTLGSLPDDFRPPVVNEARQIDFTFDLGRIRERHSPATVLPMVMRSDFDHGLARYAADCGVEIRDGVTLEGVDLSGPGTRLVTSHGVVQAGAVVGADGSASRLARVVGARYAQVDLGMEIEVAVPPTVARDWAGRMMLDFGSIPGGYAWIFPKGDVLTVGVIAAKGLATDERRYLGDLLVRFDLADLPVVHEGGHLTRCRASDSPLVADGIFLAGDAAGLLEPWTREGISFAVRSGNLAGRFAAAWAAGDRMSATRYVSEVSGSMGAEMAVGFRALAAYTKHPRVLHDALTRTSVGWRSFVRLARGETTWDRVGGHRRVRFALTCLGAP